MQRSFIEKRLLKKGETIERIEEDAGLLNVVVVRKTARTYRKVVQFKLTKQLTDDRTIPKALKEFNFTPKAKRSIPDETKQLQQWLLDGWIVREIRLNQDGLSFDEVYYRMGPVYYEALQLKKDSTEQHFYQQMEALKVKAEQLELPSVFKRAIEAELMPTQWSESRRLKYVEFCLAFYAIYKAKGLFDFKEIGASLYDEIGGSKYFDAEGTIFLEQLTSMGVDPTLYGLVSNGRIVTIRFTGNIKNDYAQYRIGAIHATTDNSVLKAPYSTEHTTLWLVENRAILTRMAVEIDFLQQTNSCIVCLDGQIRSAHRLFIEQLLKSNIKQTIIWTDTDAAGITIVKHTAALVDGPIKIVGRDFQIYSDLAQYEEVHKGKAHEQEHQLGGVEQWMKWV
ncbi:DUF2399 domain-containing protein [Kurthia gibsonii]|uniref:DUF2399 domain-containing protein n=1 Tax=Kurthia gibsonii TaxID=33946 RepID=UPI0039831588